VTGRLARIEAFLDERIAAGDFPGAVWAVVAADGRLAQGARGLRAVVPASEPTTLDTIYDLASLTKPVATAALAVLLERKGRMRLSDPVARWIPELAGTDKEAITIRQLGCHTSGLPAWLPLYADGRHDPVTVPMRRYLQGIAVAPLESPPGQRAVYSCCGYILLGEAVARAAGKPLDALFSERIERLLGPTMLGYRVPPGLLNRTAPTEADSATEREMVAKRGLEYDGWRMGIIRGEVHDGNARGLGGVSGNAGLFGTAEDLARFAVELLPDPGRAIRREPGTRNSGPPRQDVVVSRAGLFREDEVSVFTTPEPSEGEVRSFGWQLAATLGSAGDGVFPPTALGHTGFTGVSLWIDREAGRAFILLTNRIHPANRGTDMNAIRRQFHRLAADLD